MEKRVPLSSPSTDFFITIQSKQEINDKETIFCRIFVYFASEMKQRKWRSQQKMIKCNYGREGKFEDKFKAHLLATYQI